MKFIIFAGGQGTKLWPLSRESKPKQFQPVVGDKTLFRQNVEALLTEYSAQDIFVSTKRKYVRFVIEDAPEVPLENIIIEPDIAKNTGPATGFAIIKVAAKYPDEPFMIVQADCLRKPDEKFIEMTRLAEELVQKERKLITGGQKALYPDMGIDYLMLGDPIENQGGVDIFKIQKFVPRLDTYEETEKLISGFKIATHSNHYCWYPELMLEVYAKYNPQWFQSLMEIKAALGTKDEATEIERIYAAMEAGPIEDVTRHIFDQGYIIINPFKWMDMGTWGVIYEYLAAANNMYTDGNVMAIDTRNSFIKGNKDRLIATIGIDDLMIIDSDDALLICPKSRAQDVKKVIDKLKEQADQKYL
jgi:mannose-1-phosphate guanylyltransferase